MRTLRSELSKLASLPFVWIAFAAGFIVPVGISVLTSLTSTPGENTGFSELAIGVVGAIVLGVAAIGSEYTTEGEESASGRQITTTLTATTSRTRLLIAKIVAVVIATAFMAVLAIAAVFATVSLLVEDGAAPPLDADTLGRMGGALVYWVLMALLGFGLTVLTRNGIIPMAVLVANSSAVTVTYLLAQSIPAANYLPDLAGMRMFTTVETGVHMAPLTGGFVMAAWVVALLVTATAVFSRRDV
ncbi:ABC transporter permease [Brachybacterium fresconis]|uniref:ABC-type transport system involved in multi-copper enzyme maturation permease subunit n=1 Tax=Brachybacterium fresconis TaxID=173363 RepID=A0ABS4YGC2_9MICO|nr:ABC transporter permease [Brachybacterium fresconis]MBP2407844.1 ABC-type transport system involved in multi-copper enzyme maturation permease subunit [Brachybacterium fresconis]